MPAASLRDPALWRRSGAGFYVPDDLGAARQGNLRQKLGELFTRDVVAVFVWLQGVGLEAGQHPVERGERGERFGWREAVPVVIPAAADRADPIDLRPAATVRVVRYPEPL